MMVVRYTKKRVDREERGEGPKYQKKKEREKGIRKKKELSQKDGENERMGVYPLFFFWFTPSRTDRCKVS